MTLVRRVRGAGDRAFVPAIVYRREQVPDGLLLALGRVRGARAVSDRLPLAPSKDFAAALLGTVGPATAELVDDGRGRVRAGDDVGLSGLQRRYDTRLAGTRGTTVVAVDDAGRRRELFSVDPVPGRPLRTTPRAPGPAAGPGGAGRHPQRERAGRRAPLHRRPRRCGQRPGVRGVRHRHLRALRPRVHLQGGHRPGPPPRRGDPGEPGDVPPLP